MESLSMDSKAEVNRNNRKLCANNYSDDTGVGGGSVNLSKTSNYYDSNCT
jgi:hypothetical protein